MSAWAAQLREPFPPEQIGKLPKAGKMLDFVGHAAVTDRLLQVDPEWTWEPMGRSPEGLPLLVTEPLYLLGDETVGLWINLSVLGHTKPGFGGGKNIKEAISDAIKNAAMRFGVALDLWSKEDLHSPGANGASGDASPVEATGSPPGSQFQAPADKKKPSGKKITDAQLSRVEELISSVAALRGVAREQAEAAITNDNGVLDQLPVEKADELIRKLETWEKNLKAAA